MNQTYDSLLLPNHSHQNTLEWKIFKLTATHKGKYTRFLMKKRSQRLQNYEPKQSFFRFIIFETTSLSDLIVEFVATTIFQNKILHFHYQTQKKAFFIYHS